MQVDPLDLNLGELDLTSEEYLLDELDGKYDMNDTCLCLSACLHTREKIITRHRSYEVYRVTQVTDYLPL